MSIKAGDKVKLKSGGPIMTVSSVYDTDVTCEWFVNDSVKNHTFTVTSLEIYVPPKPLSKADMDEIMKMGL